MTLRSHLIACHECDLLQLKIVLPMGGTARCRRCGASLYRHKPGSVQRGLAYALAGLALFIIANLFPIVGLAVQGERHDTTLYGAVQALWLQNMEAVAALVSATTMLMPALDLGIMIYVLLALHLGRTPPVLYSLLHALQSVRPWSMVEVFMLGLLVSLVKLMHFATVIPGIALWAFGGFILLLIAAAEALNPRDVWAQLGGVQ